MSNSAQIIKQDVPKLLNCQGTINLGGVANLVVNFNLPENAIPEPEKDYETVLTMDPNTGKLKKLEINF